MAVVPSPGTASKLKSVSVSSWLKALLNVISVTVAVPSDPGVAAVTGATTDASPICTAPAAAGRRTAIPSWDCPPLPGPSRRSAVASFVDAG
jgi:hypothetical protein